MVPNYYPLDASFRLSVLKSRLEANPPEQCPLPQPSHQESVSMRFHGGLAESDSDISTTYIIYHIRTSKIVMLKKKERKETKYLHRLLIQQWPNLLPRILYLPH